MKRRHRRYKILFINSGGGHGGPSRFLYYLLCHLDRRRFEPLVAFYFLNDDTDTRKIRELGVPVHFLAHKREPLRYVPIQWLLKDSSSKLFHTLKVSLRFSVRMLAVEASLILGLRRLIRREGVELVILNNDIHYHVAGTLGAGITGTPCICRKAGGIGEGHTLKKFLTPWVDLFIAISRATEEDQLQNNPSTKKLVTVYEGIDLALFSPHLHDYAKRMELGIPAGSQVVGNVSRFDRGKGQEELLEAAALVVKSYPDVVFLLVGDGELMNELRTRTEELDLTGHVLFTGWRSDIAAILSITDIFVHCPTAPEGLGIANLEAMAMGKPSIVSENGGLPDAVLDRVTGYVVPPGDTEKLSRAILRLLEDKGLALQFGRDARCRIEEKFDIEKNVRKLERLFLSLV
ncbi:MAG TPA: glycosyltransferase family 4 protein [Dissulfurispiraceae bacterium]